MTTPAATPVANPITRREIVRIVWCLTITCVLAAAVLGGIFFFTEPMVRAVTIARETDTVRRLLDLSANDHVTEIRRYLQTTSDASHGASGATAGEQRVIYLLPTEAQRFNVNGEFLDRTERPVTLVGADAHTVDRWVETTWPGTHLVGRFFTAQQADGQPAGYVTEGEQYGFKSRIRFFVALTPDFRIRGVEVLAHEEDPGLGAEIVKPYFKHQFAGRTREVLQATDVSKAPMPATWRQLVTAREQLPFAEWLAQFETTTASGVPPIHAITGATISSRALTDGVRRAVDHLHYRLHIVRDPGGAP